MSRKATSQQLIEALNGTPAYQETVAASTTTKNVTAFSGGPCVELQSDAAFYFKAGNSTVTCTSANGKRIEANAVELLVLRSTDTHIAFLAVSGTANVKIFLKE